MATLKTKDQAWRLTLQTSPTRHILKTGGVETGLESHFFTQKSVILC
jgi:hypothetical protein